jgi:PAS domain S-box-containing protein
MASIIILFFLIIGTMLISDEIKKFHRESETARSRAIAEQRELIKNEVEQVVDYINYKKSLAEKRLRNQVRNRTYEALQVADFIYQKNRSQPADKIAGLIHDALYAISWDNDRGYYFAEDMNGVELINRNNPELEGTNIIDLQDSNGTYLVRKIIEIAKSDAKEGFCSYYWNQPQNPGILVEKISYVKYFKPLNWVIGNGKYLHAEEETIKSEIINRVKRINKNTRSNLILGDWDGQNLLAASEQPATRQQPAAAKIINQLIVTARAGGGFINTQSPDSKSITTVTKLRYCRPVSDWQWFVGSEIDLSKTERLIAANLEMLNEGLKKKIIHISIALIFLLLCSYLIARLLSHKIKKNVTLFENFFASSATQATIMDPEKLSFVEFKRLADSANIMIEKRLKSEHALKKSEDRFFQVVENAHIAMGICNKDGRTEFLNRQFTKTFGYTINDIPTLMIWWQKAYPDSDYRQKAIDLWHKDSKRVVAGKAIRSRLWFITCKNGSTREVKFNFTPIDQRYLITLHDCTEENRIARERTRLEKELNQAQKMESIGLLAGGVAHDLNNILSGIISYPEIMLLRLPEESDLRKPLTTILQSGRRAAEIVNDLLTIARGVANKKESRDLHQIINEYLESPEYGKIIKENPDISLKTNLADNLPHILCSAVHVKKCLMNLINNSAEAMPENGTIEITTTTLKQNNPAVNQLGLQLGEYVRLSVSDNGTGVSDDDIDHIFEPFYSKKIMGKSGSGLGLAVVWNTMQDHNGRVTVTKQETGIRFDLYFPAAENNDAPEKEEVSLAELNGSLEKILIIDDEPLQREVARHILEELNYTVADVSSGEEAIEWCRNNRADLIILDMMMEPGINGRETFAQIKEFRPEQKAIICSGFSANNEVEETLCNGAGTYIKKPYSIAELGTAVKQELARKN